MDEKLEMLRAFVAKLDKEFEVWSSTRGISYTEEFYDAFDYAFRAGYMAGVDRGIEIAEEGEELAVAWESQEYE